MAVSGGYRLATASVIPVSIAQRIAKGLPAIGREEINISGAIENPTGILEVSIIAQ